MVAQSFRVPLTLFTNVGRVQPYAVWNDPLNPTDPWRGYPYQWEVDVTIQSQTHSDPDTPRPYSYNGLDVKVGDWLVFTTGSIAVEIVSISQQNDSTLRLIVEDVSLNNILNDVTQSGVGIGHASAHGVYDCLIINLNSEGIPVFATIPDYAVPINLIADIVNRFESFNYIQDYVHAHQIGNTFNIGDFIYLNEDGSFTASLSSESRAEQSIGTVTSVNQPDVGDFTYRPIGRYVTNLPTLPGLPGDLLYISSTVPGGVTNVVTAGTTIPVYIKISDTSAIFTSGTGGGGGGANVAEGEVAFGGKYGEIIGNTSFTFDRVTSTLGIGNIQITGDYITTAAPGDNLILSANSANVQILSPLDMTDNRIVNLQDPVNPQDAATKSYVDAVASGLNIKLSVYAATTDPLDATFTTAVAHGALTSNTYETFTVDGVSPPVGARILVKNQTDEIQNGIYTVVQTGGPSESWILTRSTDFNGVAPAGTVRSGDFTFVEQGDMYSGAGWVMNSLDPVTLNISPIHWTQFSSAGVILPGFGLTQSGMFFNVNAAAFIETTTALKTITGPEGKPIIELQLDPNSPLIFSNNALSISSTIASTGLSYINGALSVNPNQPQITGLGTINSGTWNATPISYQYGGTGLTSLGTAGQVLGTNSTQDGVVWLNHSQITEGDQPPIFPTPVNGDRWYNTTIAVLFTYISDDTGSHWIQLG
jgi:hypothetical protein